VGEYWKPVNLTRKEWIHPHDVEDGLKWGEWTATGSRTRELMAALWPDTDTIVAVSDYGGRRLLNGTLAPPHLSLTPQYDDLVDSSEWLRISGSIPK
jgi:hypothetical protein